MDPESLLPRPCTLPTKIIKLKRSEFHIGQDKSMANFWGPDPAVSWDRVRCRSIRNLDDDCMVESLLSLRHTHRTPHSSECSTTKSTELWHYTQSKNWTSPKSNRRSSQFLTTAHPHGRKISKKGASPRVGKFDLLSGGIRAAMALHKRLHMVKELLRSCRIYQQEIFLLM